MQRAWYDGRVEACALEILLARQVPVHVNGFRGPALADDGGDLVVFLGIDEDERLAAEAVEILFEHAACDQRRDAGVERVAAFQENGERGGRGEGMTGGHATGRAHDRRPQRRTGGLPILHRHLCRKRSRERQCDNK